MTTTVNHAGGGSSDGPSPAAAAPAAPTSHHLSAIYYGDTDEKSPTPEKSNREDNLSKKCFGPLDHYADYRCMWATPPPFPKLEQKRGYKYV